MLMIDAVAGIAFLIFRWLAKIGLRLANTDNFLKTLSITISMMRLSLRVRMLSADIDNVETAFTETIADQVKVMGVI